MSLRELAYTVKLAYSTIVNRYQRGDRGDTLIRPADSRHGRRVVVHSADLTEEFHVERVNGSAR